MQPSEAYKHLGDVYFNSARNNDSKNKKRFPKPKKRNFIYLIIFCIIIASGSALITNRFLQEKAPSAKKDIALIIEPNLSRLDYDFSLGKKGRLSFDIDNLGLRQYKFLAFLARTGSPKQELYLRVELTNRLFETSEFYIKGISSRWKEFRVNLADFEKITDFSKMFRLEFTIEEWNAKEKQGRVYIDNVRFLK